MVISFDEGIAKESIENQQKTAKRVVGVVQK